VKQSAAVAPREDNSLQLMTAKMKLGESIQCFDRIAQAIRSGRCIPFLGAGVSLAFKDWRNGQAEVPGCPSGWELKEILEKALRAKPFPSPELDRIPFLDLPSVAEFYVYFDNGQRGELEEKVKEAIQCAKCPRPIHWVLSSIPSVRCVFTTNYDELVEEACRYSAPKRNLLGPYVYDQSKVEQAKPEGIPVDIATNRPFRTDGGAPAEGYPILLYKMHGSMQHHDSLLITTYDYVRYIASWRDERLGMPKEFRDLLLKNTILFLGYGLGDWNFRVIWEAMIGAFPGGRFPIQSYAIKKDVTDFERSLFALRNIALIECDLTLFARALAEEFGFTIPGSPPSVPGDALPGGVGL
jgi:hypothetical protein